MSKVIEIESLRHSYGRDEVLKGVNLTVERGSIYGFLRRNGTGKSTCIRILAGLLARTSGQVQVLGRDPASWGRETLEHFGYAPETAFLPGQARVGSLVALHGPAPSIRNGAMQWWNACFNDSASIRVSG